MTGRLYRVSSSPDTVGQTGHALEHHGEVPLLGAEADEHGAMFPHWAERRVAAKYLAKVILVSSGDM